MKHPMSLGKKTTKFDLMEKKQRLEDVLKRFDTLAVAYSGGVDSTFLLAVASHVLKKDLVAVTAVSAIHPESEKKDAQEFSDQLGIRHVIFKSAEMDLPDFRNNRKDRCYICKKSLFKRMIDIARDMGIQHVAHGANADDLNDYRQGYQAALEMGIVAPLLDAGLKKNEIRTLSKDMGLPTWNKPAMACLASRIPYGVPITMDILKMISQAEDIILGLGIRSCRVRHHDNVARIELDPADFEKLMIPATRSTIVKKLMEIGYAHVALDLEGYMQGSMNR